jgi:hypothetical protein
MSKKVLMLIAIILVFSACELQAAVINSTWVGDERGSWRDASNWNPAIVPDNSSWRTFVVTIDGGTSGVEVGLEYDQTIDQLDCYGEVEFQIWTNDWVKLTFDAHGLTNHGHFTIEDPGMDINGNLFNLSGATFEISCNEVAAISGSLDNAGVIMIIPNTGLWVGQTLRNAGHINVYASVWGVGELLDNNDTGVIQGFGFIYSNQLLQNKGAIYASGGSLAIHSRGSITNTGILANKAVSSLHIKPAEDVNNLGTIEVNAGGGVAFDCNMVNEPNAVIKLLGGTLAATTITQKAGATFQGFGGITGNIMINPNGLIELTGPTNIVGDVTIENNAVLEISNGQTLIVGHTINNGFIRVVNGNAVFQGGYSGSGIVQKD